MDEWIPLEGFPKYEINREGRVRHGRTERVVTPSLTQFGTAYVSLVRDSRRQLKRSLALLVAKTFIPRHYEYYDTPIQLDGDRLNCRVVNLKWRPRWFALQYHKQFKARYYYPVTRPIMNLATRESFREGMGACVAYGLLERDLHLSIVNRTVCWPLMQQFDYL